MILNIKSTSCQQDGAITKLHTPTPEEKTQQHMDQSVFVRTAEIN